MPLQPNTENLVKILEEEGLDVNSIEKAQKAASENNTLFTDALVDLNLVKKEKLSEYIARSINVEFRNLIDDPVDLEIAKQLPEKMAFKYQVILSQDSQGNYTLIMGDPLNIEAIEDAKTVLGQDVAPVLADDGAIQSALENIYQKNTDQSEEEENFEEDGDSISDDSLDLDDDEDENAPIIKIVDLILMDSLKRNASDIHIEPFEKKVRVRFRVDGHLVDALTVPKKHHGSILARIKIMANLDITENRIPQDGRFKMKIGQKEVDYRVSILPVFWGGKIVLRSLDKSNLKVGLNDLGFNNNASEHFTTAIKKPFGMIIVTGPTGSGKSTTLYSILNELNSIDRNLITVEDPIEYQVAGITQVQAKSEIGMTFANALKAILRQSPDVVMIGEIRDAETADIAVKASLTGQIVLSTLHTNDAAGAVVRLKDMGVESFLISSSLTLVAAQRLCRRLCEICKVRTDYSAEELIALGFDTNVSQYVKNPTFYKAQGCAKCARTGYSGRVSIVETMLIDEQMQALIEKNASAPVLKVEAMKKGMLTLRTDALLKMANGIISVDEVLRVTTSDDIEVDNG